MSSEQHLKPTRTEDALVAEGLPEEANGLEKTTETEAHSSLATVHACPFPVMSVLLSLSFFSKPLTSSGRPSATNAPSVVVGFKCCSEDT